MQGNHLVNAHRFLGWALALFLLAGPGFAATLTGRVVAVSDGDTLTVLDAERTQHKIRLSGIDAPEKAQAFLREHALCGACAARGRVVAAVVVDHVVPIKDGGARFDTGNLQALCISDHNAKSARETARRRRGD